VNEEISVINVEPQLVLGMRKTGPYQSIMVMSSQLCQFVAQNGIQTVGHPMFICHETTEEEAMKAYKENNADVEVVVPIATRGNETEEITCYELPGAKMAKISHEGPYEDETTTYKRLVAWLEQNKKTVTGPMREICLIDPHKRGKKEMYIEIYAPID
jgi:effector-binding domain-containing protein